MESSWQNCKNILCIRPDNMGDLLMTGPALRALKESFACKITVLTSTMAAGIAGYMPEVDDVITGDMPWVKTEQEPPPSVFYDIIGQIKKRQFDAAIIFTVYSQNPLPTVMLAYLAGIPKRLAYCRENPYGLLTNWVPDREPYALIKHQVLRDLDLVAAVGAHAGCDRLILSGAERRETEVHRKLLQMGVNPKRPWLIMHPGVSELKRQYPLDRWIAAGRRIIDELGYQVLITGSSSDRALTDDIQKGIGEKSYSLGGSFDLGEFIALVKMAPLIISVNTGPVHIAAAAGTPVIVLYALTNPQHTPWKVPHVVLPFSIDGQLQSKNEIIKFVHQRLYSDPVPMPGEDDILAAVNKLLGEREVAG